MPPKPPGTRQARCWQTEPRRMLARALAAVVYARARQKRDFQYFERWAQTSSRGKRKLRPM
eukprot:1986169-Pyramimonas_sp.AAC.1